MKIIVDELPYYGESCPFDFGGSWGYELCPYRNDEEKCPQYWSKEKVCSPNNPGECERLIEYDEFIRRTEENQS